LLRFYWKNDHERLRLDFYLLGLIIRNPFIFMTYDFCSFQSTTVDNRWMRAGKLGRHFHLWSFDSSVEHDPVPGSRSNRILQFRTGPGSTGFRVILPLDEHDWLKWSHDNFGTHDLLSWPWRLRCSVGDAWTNVVISGDSRIKKVGGPLRDQGKSRGADINVYLAWWFFVFLKIKLLWFTLSNPTWACGYR